MSRVLIIHVVYSVYATGAPWLEKKRKATEMARDFADRVAAKWITTFPKCHECVTASRFISRYIISPSRAVLFIIVGTPFFPSYVVQDVNRLIDFILSDRPTVTPGSRWPKLVILFPYSFFFVVCFEGMGTFSSRFMFTRLFWPFFVGDGAPPFFF